MIYGIDYGSKLAGTTVIAKWDRESDLPLQFAASRRKSDADTFLKTEFLRDRPTHIFIDAPLSLPGVYRELPGYDDHFYRVGDRKLKAMSPMFLGGLTARAMQLTRFFREQDCTVYETYPAALARHHHLQELNYKKQLGYLPDVINALRARAPIPFQPGDLRDWHHVDAYLTIWSAHRFFAQEALVIGDAIEGVIVV